MRVHHYPAKALRADLLRAALGLALTGTPLLAVRGSPATTAVLAALAGLFVIFGLRTWLRRSRSVAVTEEAISTPGLAALNRVRQRIAWRDLHKVKLSYYSTKRDRSQGWMQLRLSGGRTTLKIDSTVDGFVDIAAHTAAVVRANDIALNPATVSNFAALGITFEDGGAGARREGRVEA